VFVARKGTDWGTLTNKGTFRKVDGATKIWPFFAGETLTYARRDGKLGFINTDGAWVIEPRFEKAGAFRNGLGPVYLNENWGDVYAAVELVVQPEYPDAEVVSDGALAAVTAGKDWGFIENSGRFVVPAEYGMSVARIGFLSSGEDKGLIQGLARGKHTGRWGF